MKTLISLILIISVIIYAFDINMSLRPFKITVNSPYYGIGIILFIVGLTLMFYQVSIKAKNEGVKQVFELIEKQLDEKTN